MGLKGPCLYCGAFPKEIHKSRSLKMKVKELIEKLQTQNPEASVLLYVFEDFNNLLHITTKAQNQGFNNELYCKGYAFKDFEKDHPDVDYIVLVD